MANEQEENDLLTRLGYEPRDVSTGPLLKWTLGLAVFVALSLVVSLLMFRVAMPSESLKKSTARPPVAARFVEDAPILQANAAADIREFRRKEELVLHSYGWVDRSKGVAQIPIERAVELTARRGLPVRSNIPTKETEQK